MASFYWSGWCQKSENQHSIYCGFPANIYLFKMTTETLEEKRELCSKLTTKTREPFQCRRSGVFIANFEHISHICQVFLLLTFNK